VNNLLDVKNNDEHALEFALLRPSGGLLLCLRVITVALGDLTKHLADVDTLLFLISDSK
jgi:hypothetical protein